MKNTRGVGSELEQALGLPEMQTAPPYKEDVTKLSVPGKEGGDNVGIHTNKMTIGKPK